MLEIKELMAFSHRVRGRFAEKLGTLTWEEVTEDREATFHSMKNILLHMIDNEDWIVNWVVTEKPGYQRRPADDYTSMDMVLEHMRDVESRADSYLRGASEEALGRRVTLSVSSGKFPLSVEECILQSFTEQTYHLGELIALMWQIGVEPPPMQWFRNNPRSP